MINIDEKLLTISTMSRPGIKLDSVKKIVLHYVQNHGSTAIANRNYFENLKHQDRVSVSSHYIVGFEGEIIKIIPENEIAYHSGSKEVNRKSIGVECTQPDSSGKLLPKTYNSLIELLADISERYNLDPFVDIIRHYDVTGKNCPKYYIDNPLEFDKLKNDVKNRMFNI
jgi:N-acetylmuramoyl-L-alanine amidase